MAERNPDAMRNYPATPITRSVTLNPTTVEIGQQMNLCRVKIGNIYRGYKKDILAEKMNDSMSALFTCQICKGIMKDACISNSGGQFCSCCELMEHPPRISLRRGSSVPRRTLTHSPPQQIPNVTLRKTVNSLKCSCPLSERGCKWLGTLEYCEEHLDTCVYVRDKCKLGCGEVLQRNKLKVHEEKCPDRNKKYDTTP